MKLREIRRLSKASPVKGVANAVLFELLTHVGEEPVVWPSQEEIGETIGFSSRAVRRALIALEEAGVVTRTGRRRHGVTEYRISVELLEQRSACPVEPDEESTGRSVHTGRSVQADRTERPPAPDGASYKEKGREKEEKERVTAPPSTELFPDKKSNVNPKAKRPTKPKTVPCPWPTVDAMLADPKVVQAAIDKGMMNGTIRIEAEKFLTNQEAKRHIDWRKAWVGTWCNNWITFGSKQSHSPTKAAPPTTGPFLYRVYDDRCERQDGSGKWLQVSRRPAELVEMEAVKERGVEFDWSFCSKARASELQAELSATQGAAA